MSTMNTNRYSEKNRNHLTAIDLFCGAGGLTLGLKQAGFSVVAGIELDPIAAESYKMNHTDTFCIQEDIRKVDPKGLMKLLGLKRGELSLLAGCPPCQGFSTLRTYKKERSVSDERNNLLFEYLKFIEIFYPKAIMMENVPALANDWRMQKFKTKLQELGYLITDSSVRVENAADYGVPQRRRRMIMLVIRDQKAPLAPKSKHVSVGECFSKAALKPVGMQNDPLHDKLTKHTDKIQEIIRSIPKDGGSRTSLPEHLVLPCHKRRTNGFRDVYGRMRWNDVAPTITGGCTNPSKGRYLHPFEDRAISLREAALLQTFPIDYKFSFRGGKGRVALMIGNAIPPEFIKRHASILAEILKESKQHEQ